MELIHGKIYLFKLLFCIGMVLCFLIAAGLAMYRNKQLPGLGVVGVGLLFLAVGWGFDMLAYSPLFSPESPFEGSIPHVAGAWGGAGLGGALIVLGLFLSRARPTKGKR